LNSEQQSGGNTNDWLIKYILQRVKKSTARSPEVFR